MAVFDIIIEFSSELKRMDLGKCFSLFMNATYCYYCVLFIDYFLAEFSNFTWKIFIIL